MTPLTLLLLFLSVFLCAPPSYAGRDFNATTSKIEVTSYTALNALDTLTICLWAYRRTLGESNAGRFVEKTSGFILSTQTLMNFFANRWSTTNGQWTVSHPTANAWHHICVTYDYGSTTNDPIFYVDGVSQTVSEVSAPVGTLDGDTDLLVIGNRTDSARTFDGYLAELYIWNVILTATEISTLSKNANPAMIRPGNIVLGMPLHGQHSPEINPYGNTGTLTDAGAAPHIAIGGRDED